MLIARSVAEIKADVPGIRFRTDARPKTTEENKLQEIQSALSGGMPLGTTLPHLNYYWVALAEGSSYSAISLWVPQEQWSQAVALLESAGYTVT